MRIADDALALPGAENLNVLEVLGSSDEVLPLVAARMAAAAGMPLTMTAVRAAVAVVSPASAAPAAAAAADGPGAAAAVAAAAPGPGQAAAPAAEGGGRREAGSVPGAAAQACGGLGAAGARASGVTAREAVALAAPCVAAAGVGAAELRSTVASSAAGGGATPSGQSLDRGMKPCQSTAATAPATPTRPELSVDAAEPQRLVLPPGPTTAASAPDRGREAGEHPALAQIVMLPGPRSGLHSGPVGADASVGSAVGPDALGASNSAAAHASAPDSSPAGAAGSALALRGGGAAPVQALAGDRDPPDLPQAGAGAGRCRAVSGAASGTLSLSVSGIELDELPES